MLLVNDLETLAEREGFEPSVRYYRTLAFQASALNHSAISPDIRIFYKEEVRFSILGGDSKQGEFSDLGSRGDALGILSSFSPLKLSNSSGMTIFEVSTALWIFSGCSQTISVVPQPEINNITIKIIGKFKYFPIIW